VSPAAAKAAQRRPRATRQLDATLRVLLGSDQHPSAEQVFHAVRGELPAVSRGTVYRNLGKLLASERVRVVHVHDRCARYDARLDPHDHFVCTRCTMLLDVERGQAKVSSGRARVRGHRVEGRTLTYFGVCRRCEGQGMKTSKR
jgi:Fur family peroxide stress response transcriptional regulator